MGSSMPVTQHSKQSGEAINSKVDRKQKELHKQKSNKNKIAQRLITQNKNNGYDQKINIVNKYMDNQIINASDGDYQIVSGGKGNGVVLNDSQLSSKLSLFSVVQQYVISKDSQSYNFQPIKEQSSDYIFKVNQHDYQNLSNQNMHINCSISSKQQLNGIHLSDGGDSQKNISNIEKNQFRKNKLSQLKINQSLLEPTSNKNGMIITEINVQKLQNGIKQHEKSQQVIQNTSCKDKHKKQQNSKKSSQKLQRQHIIAQQTNTNVIKGHSKQQINEDVIKSKITEKDKNKGSPQCLSPTSNNNINNIELKKKPSSMPPTLQVQSSPLSSTREKPQAKTVEVYPNAKNNKKNVGKIASEGISTVPQLQSLHLITTINSTHSQPNLPHNYCDIKVQPITKNNHSDNKNSNYGSLGNRPRKLIYF